MTNYNCIYVDEHSKCSPFTIELLFKFWGADVWFHVYAQHSVIKFRLKWTFWSLMWKCERIPVQGSVCIPVCVWYLLSWKVKQWMNLLKIVKIAKIVKIVKIVKTVKIVKIVWCNICTSEPKVKLHLNKEVEFHLIFFEDYRTSSV